MSFFIIVLIFAALCISFFTFMYIRQKRNGKIRRRKIEAIRYKYKKALTGNDTETAFSLGIQYYSEIGKGKITDVDRKRVEYAITAMKLEREKKAVSS